MTSSNRRLLALAVLAGALAWSMDRPARAKDRLGIDAAAVALLILPSSTGPEMVFRSGQSRDFRWVIAWPFQIPLGLGTTERLAHRLVLGPEVAFGTADRAFIRGRAGYRFAWNKLIVGLGLGGDRSAFFVSPELGLRLPGTNGFDFNALFTVRCDVEPFGPGVRASAMLGWALL